MSLICPQSKRTRRSHGDGRERRTPNARARPPRLAGTVHTGEVEIDENLMRGNLSPAQEAAAVSRRREIYELLHPETRQGAARWNQNDKMSFASWRAALASVSRGVRLRIRTGSRLASTTNRGRLPHWSASVVSVFCIERLGKRKKRVYYQIDASQGAVACISPENQVFSGIDGERRVKRRTRAGLQNPSPTASLLIDGRRQIGGLTR